MVSTAAAPGQRERSDQMRARLIDATITCIAAHGYPATTTRRVAETAEASLGAIAHHFPVRLDLIVTALDEVGRRMAVELRAAAAEAVATRPQDRTPALLDVLWTAFTGNLFGVWVKVWIAAVDDPELYAALAPLEPALSAVFAAIADDVAPEHLPRAEWTRRIAVALDAMRGLALTLTIQPRPAPIRHDPWPTTRTELTALLDRPAT
ncbi:TetR/AcrR family transcriptional regulator [Nocardia sp. NPDC020380]|uniref:TetR/AcrR family transcriptional regulator n=1 Tax=Nocardia sp. NPDC020380 TaxID=3364309 RepID=UPI003790F667